MTGIRAVAASLRGVGEEVSAEWSDETGRRFHHDTVAALLTASAALARAADQAEDEIRRARRDL